MKNKRKITMIVISVFLVVILSVSVYASTRDAVYAIANETRAWAYSFNIAENEADYEELDVVARMSNAIDWTGETYTIITKSVSAEAWETDLPSGAPLQTSRASSYRGETRLGEAYW